MPDHSQTCPAGKPASWCEKRGLSPAVEYRGPPDESALIIAAMGVFLLLMISLQRKSQTTVGRWLPEKGTEKREYEEWVLRYSVFWMGIFGIVVVTGVYEMFNATAYFVLCAGLAAPLVLQPLLARGPLGRLAPSPGAQHAARAQLWIAIFGFIGNWWYTHYFYCVLRAKYTMPSWRFNDVPIAMFAATHFYFSSYHVFANLPIRYVRSAYEPGPMRVALEVTLVLAMSYFVAFMETFTISNFPYYDFENRDLAYTVGSAFYGIYFIVSFPAYFVLDEPGKVVGAWYRSATPLLEAAVSALATGMMVLMLLDVTRLLSVGAPLQIGGKFFEVTGGRS